MIIFKETQADNALREWCTSLNGCLFNMVFFQLITLKRIYKLTVIIIQFKDKNFHGLSSRRRECETVKQYSKAFCCLCSQLKH